MRVSVIADRLGPEVVVAALFGSVATGEADELSDVDVLIVCRVDVEHEVERLKPTWAEILQINTDDLVIYTTDVVEGMAKDGSILLDHVRRDGVIFIDRDGWFAGLPLAPFEDFGGELQMLQQLTEDVEQSWKSGQLITLLDLHALAVVVRNGCMLWTVFSGRPAFGRMSAFWRARELASSLPVSEQMYLELVRWRAAYRSAATLRGLPSKERCDQYLASAKQLLEFLRRMV